VSAAAGVSLAEALEPLYRNYLRRLDEMVARLPEGAALTERTTHQEGRLALGENGLPLRFDVADARDGHTWEVHGAHPDEPLARELRVADLQVRLEPGNWEELAVVCAFATPPPAGEAEELAGLFRSFASFGGHGGFAGHRSDRGTTGADRWTGRAHGLHVELRGNELWAILDLGTCPPQAVEDLCNALSGYSAERARLAFVRIGGGAQQTG
jgi:hypothetical protein